MFSRIKQSRPMCRKFPRTQTTIKHMKDILPNLLRGMRVLSHDKPQSAIHAWEFVLEEKYKGMSLAVGCKHGALFVKVKNSSVYSKLKSADQRPLLLKLRELAPETPVKRIHFFLG